MDDDDPYRRVAAKARLWPDPPPRTDEQLSRAAILRHLTSSTTWRVRAEVETRAGFSVELVRHSDAARAWLHYYHVIDELYRLVRWEASPL